MRVWRHQLGFSQQALVVAAGVSIATIVLIEKYGHVPRKNVRARIASALGVKENLIWPDLPKPEANKNGD